MFGDGRQNSIPMQDIKESSVQGNQYSPKTPNPTELTRSIRCLQIVCAGLVLIVIVMAATLGSLMSEQAKRVGATESRADLLHSEIEQSAYNLSAVDIGEVGTNIADLNTTMTQMTEIIKKHSSRITDFEDLLHSEIEQSVNNLSAVVAYNIGEVATNIADLNTTMTQIELDIADLNTTMTQIELDRRNDLLTIQSHTTEITELESNNRNLTEIIQEHSSRITDFEDLLHSEIEQSVNNLSAVVEYNIGEVATNIADLNTTMTQIELDIADLNTTMTQIELDRRNDLLTIQSHTTEITELESNNRNLTEIIQEHSSRITDFEDLLHSEIEQSVNNLSAVVEYNIGEVATNIADLNATMTQIELDRRNDLLTIQSYTTEITELESKNRNLTEIIQEHSSRITDFEGLQAA